VNIVHMYIDDQELPTVIRMQVNGQSSIMRAKPKHGSKFFM